MSRRFPLYEAKRAGLFALMVYDYVTTIGTVRHYIVPDEDWYCLGTMILSSRIVVGDENHFQNIDARLSFTKGDHPAVVLGIG